MELRGIHSIGHERGPRYSGTPDRLDRCAVHGADRVVPLMEQRAFHPTEERPSRAVRKPNTVAREEDRDPLSLGRADDRGTDIDRVHVDEFDSQGREVFSGPHPHRAHSPQATRPDSIQAIRSLRGSHGMDMIRLRDSFGPVREDMDIVTAPRLDLGEGRNGRRVAADDGWELLRHMEDSHVGRGFPRTGIKLSGQKPVGCDNRARPRIESPADSLYSLAMQSLHPCRIMKASGSERRCVARCAATLARSSTPACGTATGMHQEVGACDDAAHAATCGWTRNRSPEKSGSCTRRTSATARPRVSRSSATDSGRRPAEGSSRPSDIEGLQRARGNAGSEGCSASCPPCGTSAPKSSAPSVARSEANSSMSAAGTGLISKSCAPLAGGCGAWSPTPWLLGLPGAAVSM